MKKKLILVLIILPLTIVAQEWLVKVDYNIGVPGQQIKSYIHNTSFLGFSVDARRMVSSNVSIGASMGHQAFYWKTQNHLDIENGLIFVNQYRFLNTLPIMLNSHYYLDQPSLPVKPYAGMSLGAYYIWKRSDAGIVVLDGRQWYWGLAPEIGFFLPVGSMRLNVSGRWNLLNLSSDAFIAAGQEMFFSLNLGVVMGY